jgi:protease I
MMMELYLRLNLLRNNPQKAVRMKRLLLVLALAGFLGCAKASEPASQESSSAVTAKGKVLFAIAPRNFRDEELNVARRVLSEAGFETVIASTDTTLAQGMLGAKVKPDLSLSGVNPGDYKALVIVGGSGATVLWDDTTLIRIAKEFSAQKKVIGAICLAPVVLARAGILSGIEATCFESAEPELVKYGATYVSRDVVVSGRVVTGSGPAAAREFAEKLLELLKEGEG